MVVGKTDLYGEASRVSKAAREHEPRGFHPSINVAQAIL